MNGFRSDNGNGSFDNEKTMKKLIGREMTNMAGFCLKDWASNKEREEMSAIDLVQRIIDRYVESATYLNELLDTGGHDYGNDEK